MHLVGFEAMDLLHSPESTTLRALAAAGGVNTWSCLLPDADLVFCRCLRLSVMPSSQDLTATNSQPKVTWNRIITMNEHCGCTCGYCSLLFSRFVMLNSGQARHVSRYDKYRQESCIDRQRPCQVMKLGRTDIPM